MAQNEQYDKEHAYVCEVINMPKATVGLGWARK